VVGGFSSIIFEKMFKTLGKDKAFYDWLVGYTDGDGNFYFAKTKNGVWHFCFSIAQSTYNLRALYHIKTMLAVGSVDLTKADKHLARYRIRNSKHIYENLIPIFDEYPLLTKKYFQYLTFRKALEIHLNPTIASQEKNELLLALKTQNFSYCEISPALQNLESGKELKEKREFWLVGFVEAEASFYIVQKDFERMVHAFEITQKSNQLLLEKISEIFDINLYYKKRGFWTIVTTKNESIEKVINFFLKKMKGIKSLEFTIWARSFRKKDTSFEYLISIQKRMRNIRSIRFGKDFKKVK